MEIYLKTRLPFGSTGFALHSSLSIPFDVAEVYGFLSDIKIKNKFNDLGQNTETEHSHRGFFFAKKYKKLSKLTIN